MLKSLFKHAYSTLISSKINSSVIEKHAQNVILQEKHQQMLMRLIFLILLIL
nr:MAG TPA: hypothetical protein [Bacteriophage sp.]